jgi:hypothetical protein
MTKQVTQDEYEKFAGSVEAANLAGDIYLVLARPPIELRSLKELAEVRHALRQLTELVEKRIDELLKDEAAA